MSTHEIPNFALSSIASLRTGFDWTWMLYPSSLTSVTFYSPIRVSFFLRMEHMEQPRRVSSGPIPFFDLVLFVSFFPFFSFSSQPLASRGLGSYVVISGCAGHSRDWKNTHLGQGYRKRGKGKAREIQLGRGGGNSSSSYRISSIFLYFFIHIEHGARGGGVTEATGLPDATTQEEMVRIWDGISTQGLCFCFSFWIGLDWVGNTGSRGSIFP